MTEKESTQNHLCLKVIKVLVQGLICDETESFQGLVYKNRRRTLPEGAFRKRFGKRENTVEGVPLVRFKFSKGETKLVGAREPRWSPAAIHGEAGGSEGTSVLRAPFRVGGWWTWPSESTTSTATLSPADGGSGEGGTLRWLLHTSNWCAGQRCGCTRRLLA